MQFSKSVIEIIKERTSWRTFLNKAIDSNVRQDLEHILELNNFESPFKSQGGNPRFQLISIPDFNPEENIKIGTYGFIKGAQEFIAGATDKAEYDLENYGYIFEAIILAVTDLNLGTCWLGGTFSRSQFSKFVQLKNGEKIPAISPVGYPTTRRLKEKVIRSIAKAKLRKPWEQIFFYGDFNSQIEQDELGKYKTILEMVRIGPSAGNKQPWIILKEKEQNIFHFFVKYSDDKKVSAYNQFVRLDIGIAVCHFDLTAKELGMKGKWEFNEPTIDRPKELKYIVSWIES
ncbi:MAG: nitroreductase family protein [Candidatus Lokiarchaeota archaeon]|nr:nitroreductase family protein [Candidatus Lokiarchaeota archaeon]